MLERAVADLYTIVKRHRAALPLVLARHWTSHILLAVDFMHEMGVIHRVCAPAPSSLALSLSLSLSESLSLSPPLSL